MLLKVDSLSHRFPGMPPLFERLTFEVPPGVPTAVVGPSGSGKSTLMSIVAGWHEPTSGTVELQDISTTCWVFQNPYGVARRTALDHVVLPLLSQGLRRRDAERQALDMMDLFRLRDLSDRLFRHLSGGEAQRLMLARAVATRPDLLLVDEPTAQLDLATAHTVNEVLAGIAESGAVVLVATHDPSTRDACAEVVDLAHAQASAHVAA
ncbi:ATP-binding cassette domain-containing protein [Demequina capsici]|uniref:ATP-binding cassette domain-containing protein n=1 Tax=Demequina capsici TaxID=3075620 RepID=A0AA96FEB1_9MICO|nr:ATP-binding cassette domain-containing protein [Demequina sp. PMTSA13]WNM27026.1 ATP-binding cassette domain-containing protein [Demequina sp. PMTSA13]